MASICRRWKSSAKRALSVHLEDALRPVNVPIFPGTATLQEVSAQLAVADTPILLVKLRDGSWYSMNRVEVTSAAATQTPDTPWNAPSNRIGALLFPDMPLDSAIPYLARWPVLPIQNRASKGTLRASFRWKMCSGRLPAAINGVAPDTLLYKRSEFFTPPSPGHDRAAHARGASMPWLCTHCADDGAVYVAGIKKLADPGLSGNGYGLRLIPHPSLPLLPTFLHRCSRWGHLPLPALLLICASGFDLSLSFGLGKLLSRFFLIPARAGEQCCSLPAAYSAGRGRLPFHHGSLPPRRAPFPRPSCSLRWRPSSRNSGWLAHYGFLYPRCCIP